ncbi:MAG TPA: hypothetical protein VFI54_26520 [Solirubrobacteraceae bacterium]|nr:hypothetical protein [Solirubrobacteraceae bacterium]
MSDEVDIRIEPVNVFKREAQNPKRAVVNVAFGVRRETGVAYSTAQARLVKSVKKTGRHGGSMLTWCEQEPGGAASHDEVQYHFKGVALAEAAAKGHETLLWLDAVMVVVKPMAELWDQIESRGYVLWSHPPGGWIVGEWTSDACLKCYGLTRNEARGIPMLCSGAFGYSLGHPLGKKLHEAFVAAPPHALRGRWHNKSGHVSKDKRVKGHRHDQSVLSIIAHQLGLEATPTPEFVAPAGQEDERTTIVHDMHGVRGW